MMDPNLNLNIYDRKLTTKRKPKRFTAAIASRNRRCHFCDNQNGQYVCSKCHRPYCSIDCFRSQTHLDCSEQFYKRLVLEHLKNVRADDKEKFMDILRRNQHSTDYVDLLKTSLDDDGDEAEEVDLDWIADDRLRQFMERITSICLDDNVDLESIWTDRLTESERMEFVEIIQTNPEYFNRIIPEWQPWWCRPEWQAIVEDVDNIDSAAKTYPTLLMNEDEPGIEPISKLLSQKMPSPLLIHSIISVCFAYCYLCRLHNGEIFDINGDDDLLILFHIVPELQPNVSNETEKPFETIEILIKRMLTIDDDDPLNNIHQRKAIIIQLLDDLEIIIDWNRPGRRLFIQTTDKINHQSPKAILLILSDFYRIIDNIRLHGNKNKKSTHLLQRKIRFYMSYAIEICDQIQRQNWLDALQFHRERLRQEIEQNNDDG